MNAGKLHPIFERVMAPFIAPLRAADACERCSMFDQVHDQNCPEHPDYDPTPYCSGCGSRTKSGCHCGSLARND